MQIKFILSILILGLLSACSKQEATPPAATPAPVAPVVDENLVKGERVYKGTCAMCHSTGAGGAPMLKSQVEWEPRIAQGKATLYEHAVQGFTGSKGAMPAKGGNAGLPDEDVKASVDYMLSTLK